MRVLKLIIAAELLDAAYILSPLRGWVRAQIGV